MQDKFQLQIDFDLSINPNKISIHRVFDPWLDMAFILEALNVAINHSCAFKEKTKNEMIDYCHHYLDKFRDDDMKISHEKKST